MADEMLESLSNNHKYSLRLTAYALLALLAAYGGLESNSHCNPLQTPFYR